MSYRTSDERSPKGAVKSGPVKDLSETCRGAME
jgi:hypothetical protein